MPYQVGVIDALRDWGLTVRTVSGWQTRGDSTFHPQGHVIHHDVIGDQVGTHDHVPDLIIHGRSDLAGPLCNFWLERDGDVHLVAAGEANHAGAGGWHGLSGNASVWGTEMNNLGTSADPWPDVQIEAAQRLCAATADFSLFPVANVCGHKEWTSRKIDPHSINMGTFRAETLAQAREGGFSVADIDRLVAEEKRTQTVIQNQHKLDRRLTAALAERQAGRDNRSTDEIVAAIEADSEGDG